MATPEPRIVRAVVVAGLKSGPQAAARALAAKHGVSLQDAGDEAPGRGTYVEILNIKLMKLNRKLNRTLNGKFKIRSTIKLISGIIMLRSN